MTWVPPFVAGERPAWSETQLHLTPGSSVNPAIASGFHERT
jgi:hypothetical protein